jgi:flagellar basal-body rod modification protein FlgD
MSSTVNGIDTSKATDLSSVDNQSSGLDKDTFLKLLVAEMQYQDPLEPSSSTEYMSQMAQFTSVEEMENLNSAFNKSNAESLVGSYVIMKTTDATGNEDYVSGLVDYVTITNGKPYLSINDSYYSYDDLDSIVDVDYMSALAAKDTEDSSSN